MPDPAAPTRTRPAGGTLSASAGIGGRAELRLEEPWGWVVRLRRLADRRPFVVDAVATLAFDALTVVPLFYSEDRWWVWVLDQALVLPLLWRRRQPFAVFCLLGAVALVQLSLGIPLAADAALLIGLYTVAEHQPRGRALLAAGALEIGVVLASVRFAPAGESLVSSLVFLTGMVTAALFVGTTLRTRRAYLASVVGRAERLEREREQEAELAATRERTRIARELHDIVAHSLSVMIALADGAFLTCDPAEAGAAMQTVSATGRQSMKEMRRLLGVLRDGGSNCGLAPQPGLDRVPELTRRLRQIGPPIQITVTGEPRPLPATQDATAFRIIQESLTNVVKHAAGATLVCLTLDWRRDLLQIEVRDDGHARRSAPTLSGHGITGMSERAALFAGSVNAGPAARGGWHVQASLPIAGG